MGDIFSLAEQDEDEDYGEDGHILEENIRGSSKLIPEISERLEKFRAEALEHQKRKLLTTIDTNMEFHEWMERHKKTAATSSEGGMDNEIDMMELVKLGEECGIPHPYSCKSSPFFNNLTRETLLELKNPSPHDRPFEDLKALTLVDVKDKDN